MMSEPSTPDTAEIRVPGFHGDPLLVDHLEGNRRARDRYRKAVERGDDMTDRPEPDSAARFEKRRLKAAYDEAKAAGSGPGLPRQALSDDTHPFDDFRRNIVEALGLPYGTPEMFGNTRYPTDTEIVSWVATEHERVRKMHDGHHTGVEGFCPDCGMYGKGTTSA